MEFPDGPVELLSGGNTHAGIAKIGSTVRRPTGPWTPGVHALLDHLADMRFEGAPRVFGIDQEGREVLEYIEGTVVWPDHVDLLASAQAVREVARLIRRYHDAVDGFPAARYTWHDLAADPTGAREVLCHNDLGAWNLIRTARGWAYIDWDLAAPGRRSWDLSLAMIGLLRLFQDAAGTELAIRFEAFCDGYGTSSIPPDVIAVARERAVFEADTIRSRAARGEEPFVRLLAEGHADGWERTAKHIEANEALWTTYVSRAT